jgi:hypothetical protein
MILLAIGDVFADAGRKALARWLPELQDEVGAGLTVVNAENVRAGRGIDRQGVRDVFAAGADCLTTGNHVWAHKDHAALLEEDARVLRPANYPPPCPGRGVTIATSREGLQVAVVNLIGRVFMGQVDDPFQIVDEILEEIAPRADLIVVDLHAEASSEKLAMAAHLDGRVAAVFGTHTHVQTADARVLPGGTGYITDLGMTGPYESVIGLDRETALHRFRTGRPAPHRPAAGGVGLRGAVFDLDESSGLCRGVTRIARGAGGS